MKKSIFTIAIVGFSFSVIFIFLLMNLLPLAFTSERYNISVDPIIISDEMGTETHVSIKNIGTDTLTNIIVDYGGSSKPDTISKLEPGEKMSLSPPVNSDLQSVRVTTDEGIEIIKKYRTPASASFVGNSGYGG